MQEPGTKLRDDSSIRVAIVVSCARADEVSSTLLDRISVSFIDRKKRRGRIPEHGYTFYPGACYAY